MTTQSERGEVEALVGIGARKRFHWRLWIIIGIVAAVVALLFLFGAVRASADDGEGSLDYYEQVVQAAAAGPADLATRVAHRPPARLIFVTKISRSAATILFKLP